MEPYSADDIKRRKRKHPEFKEGSIWPNKISTRAKFLSRMIKNIYDGTEKMAFKRRNIHFHEIFRNEFNKE